ncbi:MAG: hypothetical protein RIQ89_1312 [Bacteroidota bacterium]|jgi:uncharacterized protein
MTLEEKITPALKAAMIAKDEAALRALRAVKAAILLAKTSGSAFGADEEIKLVQRLVKQRKESIAIYKDQNRPDLFQPEEDELKVIEQFLPSQMSESEIKLVLQNIITEAGLNGPSALGKVMGIASKQLAGKADNKLVSTILKELLGA